MNPTMKRLTKPCDAYMFLFKWQIITLLGLCYLLSACANKPITELDQPDWEINGKLGIREAQHSNTLLFNWQQQDQRYVIHLMNTLGQIELTLTGDQQQAIAIRPDGTLRKAATPESLLLQLTGWHFPISDARLWLQGKSSGNEYDITLNAEQQPASFHAGDWQVHLSQYKKVAESQLPYRLQLQHHNNSLRLTILIKHHAAFTP